MLRLCAAAEDAAAGSVDDVFILRAHGFKIVKEPNGALTYYYIEVDDQNRNFPEKMYTNPIPQSELENNKLITQDPAWN